MDLNRTRLLREGDFVRDHLVARLPVVVAGEVEQWPAFRKWTWEYLVEQFGRRTVDLYDDWFMPTGTASFADFVARSIGVAEADPTRSYVRWFASHRPGGGHWADEVFAAIERDWAQPSFLPTDGYVVPFVEPSARVSAVRDPFPYRGLFISAKGARTRLHRDPWASSAVLCQVVGTKQVWMYSPDQEAMLLAAAAGERGNVAGGQVEPAFEGLLHPGEVLFVPDGWWHHVTSLTDSVSLTWNFVHGSVADRLEKHAMDFPEDPELEVVEHFLAHLRPGAAARYDVGHLVAAARAAGAES